VLLGVATVESGISSRTTLGENPLLLVLMGVATVESGISAPTAAAVGQHLACTNVPLNDTMIMCSARSLGGCGAS
jgi:hypothetical protein